MYTLLISLGFAILVGGGGAYLGWWAWVGGPLMGFLAFAIVWILVIRRIGKRLLPAMQLVQKQAQAGNLPMAQQTLKDMLELAPWMPGLKGQLYAQLGSLSYASNDKEKALEYLSRASRRIPEAQLFQAAILHKNGDVKGAIEVLRTARRKSRKCAKHTLLANTLAYMLNKDGSTKDAIEVLGQHLIKVKGNEPSTDNMLRLQNGKRMDMKRFEAEWYMLQLERPPADMGQLQTARKGFRTPPKRKKQK